MAHPRNIQRAMDREEAEIAEAMWVRSMFRSGDAAVMRRLMETSPLEAAQHQPKGSGSVATRSWARSGTKAARQTERPFGSWDAAIDRARQSWDGLTGGPDGRRYSDVAAASILRTAVALWPSVAAEMARDAGEDPSG